METQFSAVRPLEQAHRDIATLAFDDLNLPAVPSEWTMEFYKDDPFYVVEIERSQVSMCRLTIDSSVGNEETSRIALAHKAQLWIAGYMERPQPG